MQMIHEENLKVTPGYADASGRLGIYETFRAFMDMAAIHAELLGVGFAAMAAKGLFWLTVKTQVNFIKRPPMRSDVILRTWPEKPEKIRANRSYEALLDGETVITGKTEWAVINTENKRLVPMKGVFPEDLPFDVPTACPDPFSHISDEFPDDGIAGTYRVSSVDIDVGGHMNNAAYVRALIGAFTNKELAEMNVRRMEVIFRAPCFEGDELEIHRRSIENAVELKMSRTGETVILARMEIE